MKMADYAKVKVNIMDSVINTYNSPSLPCHTSVPSPSLTAERHEATTANTEQQLLQNSCFLDILIQASQSKALQPTYLYVFFT